MRSRGRTVYLKSCIYFFMSTLFLTVIFPAWAMGESSGIFHSLDRLVITGMSEWDIPGVAYVVVSGDEVVHKACFGVRKKGESGQDWKVDDNTVFQIGSTTKAFTSTMIAMLVDEGRVSWNDRVEKYLPGFRLMDRFAQKDFRLFDLMSQHSGLPSHSLDGMPILGYGREAILKALRYVKNQSPLRSDFAYQNAFFLCSASILEGETGRSWEDNLKTKIFEPLAMHSAGSTFEEFKSDKEHVAWLHRLKEGQSEVISMDWPWQDWVYVFGPAGSIHLDIDDFGRWLRFQIFDGKLDGKRLLSKKEMSFLTKPQTLIRISDTGSLAYCQGWVREIYNGNGLIWHNGATLGAHSIIAFIPDKKMGIAVLTNQVGNSLPEAMMKTFVDLLSGNSTKNWVKLLSEGEEPDKLVRPESPCSAKDPGLYVGTYENLVYGKLVIDRKDNGLVACFLSPKPQCLRLVPWDADTFLTKWEITIDSLDFVKFDSNSESGEIDSVTVEILDDGYGLGNFRRVRRVKRGGVSTE